jgi:hypothetical protein
MTATARAPALRRPVGFATSAAAQTRLLFASRRWLRLTAALLFAPLLFSVLGMQPRYLLGAAALVAMLAGSIWTLGVWAGEPPRRRTYHWSLPVSRTSHDVARVLAGALHLLAACAVVAAACAGIMAVRGYGPIVTGLPIVFWATFFAAPLITYLLASPAVLWSEYRVLRWGLGLLMAWGFAAVLTQHGFLMDALVWVIGPLMEHDRLGLGGVLIDAPLAALYDAYMGEPTAGTGLATWWPGALAWTAGALAATALAARFRPEDLAALGQARRAHEHHGHRTHAGLPVE